MKQLRWRVPVDPMVAVRCALIIMAILTPRTAFSQAASALGRVEVLSGPGECADSSCYEVRVTCPNVAAPARARLKVARNGKSPRGTILFTSGGLGTEWYEGAGESSRILKDVATAGFRTVQLQWKDSWLFGSPGKEEGQARLGCRPATVARWVRDHLHEPSETRAFCATGHSGGAAQVAYMLSHYGLDGILSAVVLTGGPPMSRIDRGCARADPKNAQIAFPDWATRIIDVGFGFHPPAGREGFDPFKAPGVGPCARGEASFREKLRQASVASGDGDYVYPGTMVWFVFEGIDDTHAAAMGAAYHDLLVERGSPHVRKTTIPDVTHAGPKGLYGNRNGADKVREILMDECRLRKP
jgi:hypothetical protein